MGLILAVDVGKGTEDVLIWNQEQNFENAIQLVLPSRTQLVAKQIREQINNQKTIIIDGEIMAGEPWNRFLYSYAGKNANNVIMSATAAMSLRYHRYQVANRGITVIDDDEFDYEPTIKTSDVEWNRIVKLINRSGYSEKEIDGVLLCCQDHGFPEDPKQSTRDYRMKTIYSLLEERGRLEDLLLPINQVPEDMPRHKAIGKSALKRFDHLSQEDIFVMDSSPAVVLGAFQERSHELVVNVGNGHTICIALKDSIVQFAYELHTGGVTPDRVPEDIDRIFKGELTHEESLKSGGHGLYVKNYPDIREKIKYFPITLIGPNRDKLDNLDIYKAHPIGNMMMAGPYGLVRAYKYKLNNK